MCYRRSNISWRSVIIYFSHKIVLNCKCWKLFIYRKRVCLSEWNVSVEIDEYVLCKVTIVSVRNVFVVTTLRRQNPLSGTLFWASSVVSSLPKCLYLKPINILPSPCFNWPFFNQCFLSKYCTSLSPLFSRTCFSDPRFFYTTFLNFNTFTFFNAFSCFELW